jgi:hypothetical protein
MINYKRHWAYLKYVMRHKYFVFIGARQCGCSLWRCLVHDISKFSPDEWFGYAKTFYAENGEGQYKPGHDFDISWLKHQHRNLHHWQYWLLRMDNGATIPQEMPIKYVREMIADWMGAGRAITGEWEVFEWYNNNRHKMVFHPKTEDQIDSILNIVKYYKGL